MSQAGRGRARGRGGHGLHHCARGKNFGSSSRSPVHGGCDHGSCECQSRSGRPPQPLLPYPPSSSFQHYSPPPPPPPPASLYPPTQPATFTLTINPPPPNPYPPPPPPAPYPVPPLSYHRDNRHLPTQQPGYPRDPYPHDHPPSQPPHHTGYPAQYQDSHTHNQCSPSPTYRGYQRGKFTGSNPHQAGNEYRDSRSPPPKPGEGGATTQHQNRWGAQSSLRNCSDQEPPPSYDSIFKGDRRKNPRDKQGYQREIPSDQSHQTGKPRRYSSSTHDTCANDSKAKEEEPGQAHPPKKNFQGREGKAYKNLAKGSHAGGDEPTGSLGSKPSHNWTRSHSTDSLDKAGVKPKSHQKSKKFVPVQGLDRDISDESDESIASTTSVSSRGGRPWRGRGRHFRDRGGYRGRGKKQGKPGTAEDDRELLHSSEDENCDGEFSEVDMTKAAGGCAGQKTEHDGRIRKSKYQVEHPESASMIESDPDRDVSYDSDGSVASSTSVSSRDGKYWRGRGRGRGRGGQCRHRKGESQTKTGKSRDENYENEEPEVSGRRSSNQTGRRGGQLMKGHGSAEHSKAKSEAQTLEWGKEDHKGPKPFSEEASVRTTRAAFQIMKVFPDPDSLKKEIEEKFKTSENASFSFVENSIICSANKSMCTIIVTANSNQLAKHLIKSLYSDLRKSLKTKVYFEMCDAEEKEHEEKAVTANSNKSDRSQRDERMNGLLSGALVQTCEDLTTSGLSVTERTEDNPVIIPTKVSVSIERAFNSHEDMSEFLGKAGGRIVAFEILEDTIVISESTSLCQLLTFSKGAARKLVKKLNSLKHEKLHCFVIKNDETPPDTDSKAGRFQEQVKNMLENMEMHTKKTLTAHREKIKVFENELKTLEMTVKDDEENDDVTNEILALRDKLTEALRQEREFQSRQKSLVQKAEDLNPRLATMKDLSEILKAVGVECERLRTALPIYARREDILTKVKKEQVSVILGETGSGKSTQMVQYLYESGLAGDKQIVCTQPRKVAAVTLAERVAKEMVVTVGNTVGYKTGLRKKVSANTKIIFCTDHSLLNECLLDPLLSNYSCIVVDEAHERSIYTDILLGMIKKCLQTRQDLKVIVTSATIDPGVFIKYFNCKSELRVSGRTFPVDVIYEYSEDSQEFEHFEARAVQKAIELHGREEQGDILVFLTSAVEIMRCCEEFQKQMKGKTNFRCLPLHGQLSPDEQKKVFEKLPLGIRKVVFATNCAETSVTIDGIKFVIDTGVAKEMKYDAKKNISLLGTHVISQSSADQRKGRAGRTSSGKCYRLYTETGYKSMSAINEPEILRVHLGQAVLKLAELGVDVKTYDFVQSPSTDAIDSAIRTLQELGALTSEGVTDIGRFLAKLPFDPQQGYIVYEGLLNDLLYDSVVVASLISYGSNTFYKGLSQSEEQTAAQSKSRFGSSHGDIFTWLEVYRTWVQLPKDQQSKWCVEHCINYKVMSFTLQCVKEVATVLNKEFGTKIEFTFATEEQAHHKLRKIIFQANMPSVCRFLGHVRAGYYALMVGKQVHVHPSSALVTLNAEPEWIVYTEFTKTSRDFVKGVCVVDESWIEEAVSQGLLNVNISQSVDYKIELVHREQVGRSVFRGLVGPRFTKLRETEDDLTSQGMATVVVEADRDLLTMDVYSSSPMDPTATDKIVMTKMEVLESLRSDEDDFEIGEALGQERCGFHVVVGEGGVVRNFLMPNQSNKILIKKSSQDTTEEEIQQKFEVYGTIKECVCFNKKDPWGLIRYSSHLEAQAAVDSTKNHQSNIAILKLDPLKDMKRTKLEAKLSWCRRRVQKEGTAFINCPPLLRRSLVDQYLQFPGRTIQIKLARDEEHLICFKTGNLTEWQIKDQVVSLLSDLDEKDIFVSVVREKVNVPTKTNISEMKDELSAAFGRYLSPDNFTLNVKIPRAQDINQVAFIGFTNIMAGFEACEILKGRLHMNGQPVEISPSLKTNLFVAKDIMEVCANRFEEIIKGLEQYKKMEVKIRPLKQGNFSIDIMSTKPKHIVEARDLFQKELDGEVIDCELNNIVSKLMKPQGKEFLDTIKRQEGVFILRDEHRQKIHIYGSQEKITQVFRQINKHLEELSKGVQENICLKGAGKPRGLMKALIQKYGNLQEAMIEQFGLSDVVIDFKQQKLSVLGPLDAVERVCTSVSELEGRLLQQGSPQPEKWIPDCVVCMCPIEPVSEMYRLEGCGHSYCSECLKLQIGVAVDDKKFPVTCAQENCDTLMVWRDFRFFLQKKWITKGKLVQRSLNAMVSANPKKYRFCITPNCPVVYKVTQDDEGHEFICPACSMSLCTSCHTAYHGGLTCKMSENQAEADRQMAEWQQRQGDRCKLCPGCQAVIEKTEGCNKMHCMSCGTYFCWICREIAENSQKCYAHLMKKHGDIF